MLSFRNNRFINQAITTALVLLWTYAATSKMLDYGRSQWEMRNQPLAPWFADTLVWLIPLLEVTAVLLLLSKRSRLRGFRLSAALLFSFTAYIIFIRLNFFGSIPCSCGGILRGMSWGGHLIFNLVFLGLAVYGSVAGSKAGKAPAINDPQGKLKTFKRVGTN